jgi:hypothetical protein
MPHRLAAVLAALLVLGACGEPDDEEPAMSDRPSMEAAIERYSQLRSDIIAALDGEFGPSGWAESASSRGLDFGPCEGVVEGAPPNTDSAFLPRYMRAGVYDDMDAAIAVVDRVAREHGFAPLEQQASTGVTTVYGAADELGAEYQLTFAKNVGLGIQTGCHEWDERPSAPLPTEPVRPSDDDGSADGLG